MTVCNWVGGIEMSPGGLALAGVALAIGLVAIICWLRERGRSTRFLREVASCQTQRSDLEERLADQKTRSDLAESALTRAKPYLDIADAIVELQRLQNEADQMAANARRDADGVVESARRDAASLIERANTDASQLDRDARQKARERFEAAEQQLVSAGDQARRIVQDAEQRAHEIAGDAYSALREAKHYEQVVEAMRNKIDGYGDRYIIPSYNLLDELAETYGFTEAGRELKLARERSNLMVEQERAASCDYVEQNRRQTAVRFVVDAFNGKVDSILSRTKADNVGTLTQQIRDAFALVNFNGQAFRNARITDEYLVARLDELKWGATAVALRERDREEQRQIKAQIREEEKAQREFERAKRDAEREESAVRKAMARMEDLLARAKDEQKAKYEAELALLSGRLAEAEAKGHRAVSMAQQTKSGHVYVISNLGSFGEHVYKIGMTRRLEPLDRIRELGDASVPFAFDVHAMLYADDAPAVERVLHRSFLEHQINKVNPRKEFFRVPLNDLKAEVEKIGLQASWTLAAEAAEYKETLAINAKIASDAAARARWLQQQSEMDPVVPEQEPADEQALMQAE